MDCEAVAYACECTLPRGHPEPHLCTCDGSWIGEPDTETFQAVTLPGGHFWYDLVTLLKGP
jgi:hypothetical protein